MDNHNNPNQEEPQASGPNPAISSIPQQPQTAIQPEQPVSGIVNPVPQTDLPNESVAEHQTLQQPLQPTEESLQPASGQTQVSESLSVVKQKPPVAAQILYALGFIGLIFGALASVIVILGSANIGGSFGALGSIFGFILLTVVILGFFLIHEIRHGKKWALIVYTALFSLNILYFLRDLLGGAGNQNSSLLSIIIIAPLLVLLWTKNRDYFN